MKLKSLLLLTFLSVFYTGKTQEDSLLNFDEHNKDYERAYGWAWLLKLDEALREWNSPEAKELHENLLPLVDLISGKFNEFLDKLIYPIRIGEHSNIAFGMSFAYDYAKKFDAGLAEKIEQKAREYYMEDCDCPLTWEPGSCYLLFEY